MTDKTRHNGQDISPPDKLLNSFPVPERQEIKEVWQKSGHAEQRHPKIADHEIEKALSEVHQRLGFQENRKNEKNKSGKSFSPAWLLAAAAILLALGMGYFLIPKSVAVPYGELASVELPDGTLVEMNSGTRLWYNRLFAVTNRSVALDGEAYFNVSTGDKAFLVNANESVIEVTGTRFNVRSWSSDPEGITNVTVTEGEIRFYPLHLPDRNVTLTPGMMSLWNKNMNEPAAPESVSPEKFLGWRNNMLIFNEKPLIVIINELERKYNTRIELEESEFAYETLTTYYTESRDLESVLKDICLVKGLRFAATTDGYRIYK